MKPKLGIREGMLTIVLVAFAILAGIQTQKIKNLEAEVIKLQSRDRAFNAGSIQMINNFNKSTSYYTKEIKQLTQSVGELQKRIEPQKEGSH